MLKLSLKIILGGKNFMFIGDLILVDGKNKIIGHGEKLSVHTKGDLHRAFSIFIYNAETKKFLIQKRAFNKYHSGGLWSNSCCSHPYSNEKNITDSIKRCISDELNLNLKIDFSEQENVFETNLGKIYYAGVFKYFSDYGKIKEHEIDSVYLYVINKKPEIDFNKNEICELQWLNVDEINNLLDKKNYFTSWFFEAYKIVLEFMENIYGQKQKIIWMM